ncbi:hypothetical protein FKP32DRAFT_192106 [Trametes sanguinea]|nr:hypothetical protein FKP32DRAFT_192106 [Trametes sanguinea]
MVAAQCTRHAISLENEVSALAPFTRLLPHWLNNRCCIASPWEVAKSPPSAHVCREDKAWPRVANRQSPLPPTPPPPPPALPGRDLRQHGSS